VDIRQHEFLGNKKPPRWAALYPLFVMVSCLYPLLNLESGYKIKPGAAVWRAPNRVETGSKILYSVVYPLYPLFWNKSHS
jgi:hypothetical protein